MLLPAGASNHGKCPKHWLLAIKDDTFPLKVVIVVVHVNWKLNGNFCSLVVRPFHCNVCLLSG